MPAPVLDYASPSRTPVRDFLRRLRVGLLVMAVGLLCGGVAWFAQPPKYTASACVQLALAWDSGQVTPAEVKARMDGHIAGLSQPPPADAKPPWTPEQFRRRLEIRPAAGIASQFITFTDTDPKRAAETVNAILDRYLGSDPMQPKHRDLVVAWRAVPPSPSQGRRSGVIAGIGYGVGLIATVGILLVRRSREPADARRST
jgi:hypothetical protein